MPNVLDTNGLQIASYSELLSNLTASFENIYGTDVNLSSDTPDGQWLNIMVQSILDVEDLLQQVYNSMDPDQAVGVVLDQRVAINGLVRQGGTYTVTPITLTNSSSVNLYGLDQTAQPTYTISDNAGNNWLLETTQLGLSAGSHILNFRAATPGNNLTIPNTITNQVTIVLGVASVNNPTAATTIGVNEETDAQLRTRRQQSVSLSSQGYYQGLLAALLNTNGVTSAFVYENDTSSTDSDGVPGHSIWVIVAGSPANADIANDIYQKRNAGCGMYGSTSYPVTQVDGTIFTVYWDFVAPIDLFIFFTVTSINGTTPPNIAAIQSGLVTSFVPGVYQEVNINELATLVQKIDGNTLVTNAGLSTGYTQTATLSGVAASGTFIVNYNGNASAAVNWNDSISAIQTKVRAVTGLSLANVTGSIASQSLVFDLSGIGGVVSLITVTSNTLQTSAPAAISFSFNENNQYILLPPSKKNQFVVSAANIVMLPMQLTPTNSQVAPSATQQFTGLGGYAPFVYSISINNSGGSINSSSGLYTAGTTGNVIDTVQVVDAFGNSATTTIQVS